MEHRFLDQDETVIKVRDLTTAFKGFVIHDRISFEIKKGDLCSVIGGSGSGKTTLLRVIVGLLRPYSGEVTLLGENIWALPELERERVLRRISVLFQEGALFSGLTVFDNIIFPLVEFTRTSMKEMKELAKFWLSVVGLSSDVAYKMPNELSGGMKKRVALARALILEPDIVFLDEPTSGLDPIAARNFDALIKTLHDELDATIFMISHDLASIKSLSTRVLALGQGKILADGTLEEVLHKGDLWIDEYFSSI
jgi:phospholipid/cholesterol/gamma-HCH transport system ATP-binding protein